MNYGPVANPLDPEPFRRWADEREAELAKSHEAPTKILAAELGLEERILYRWRHENKRLERDRVEDALERAGTFLWEVYGHQGPDIDEAREAYCRRCRDNVIVSRGRCPWCDDELTEAAKPRLWCERCDRILCPTDEGTCWRCGTRLRQIPWVECKCGCGREMPAFDPQGRRHEYLRGHAPRKLERSGEVPVEPFARYLERQLETIDIVAAVARAHGISREDVVRILRRDVESIDRQLVRRALWVAGRQGTGKGMPMRPDAVSFAELYPEEVRSRTCPGCGGGKAPHAELCKRCRVKRNRREGRRPPRAQSKLRSELVEEAYGLYSQGSSLMDAAEAIFERTPHRNVGSVAQALSREFKRRGWEVRRRGRAGAARS